MTRQRLSRKEVASLPVRSTGELLLEQQLRQAGIPFEREYAFVPGRKFRADFLVWDVPGPGWATHRVLVEVDGGAWISGRHTRGSGFEKDAEKASLAAINGYRVIKCVPSQVEDGTCLAWIEQALGRKAAA